MKFAMHGNAAFGVNTKLENVVRRWAIKNGHEEVGLVDADMIFYDSYASPVSKDLHKASKEVIVKYAPVHKAWLYLHDNYEVSFIELIDLFNQANSRNTEVSRLALQLVYKLRGDKYLDVQRIMDKCGFQELKFCAEYNIYKSITTSIYEPVNAVDPLSNLPLTALHCIQRCGITNQEITVPFLNWILKEFSMFNNEKIKFEAKVSYD